MQNLKGIVLCLLIYVSLIILFAACQKAESLMSSNVADIEASSVYANGLIYDTSAISSAYLSGDDSNLSDFDKQIYDKACDIISMIISDEMSDYEKELAVHDYLIYNVSYDYSRLNVFYEHDENSVNPYGALINKKAICSGYTSSFQMFMDMLGIPCRTIVANDNDGDDHAWNMVELDGEWYYVDVTWDDPVPESEDSPIHDYFNVTEAFMKESGHEWNTEGLPKANATKYSYQRQKTDNEG